MYEFEATDKDGNVFYVIVMDMFVHHYTKELMRRIRVDRLEPFSVTAMSEYRNVNESEFEELLAMRRDDNGASR